MHSATFVSDLDTFVLMIPFLAVMAMGMFRLDEVFASPKHSRKSRRDFCGINSDGSMFLTDPDGRPSGKNPVKGRVFMMDRRIIQGDLVFRPLRPRTQREALGKCGSKQ